MPLDKPPSIEGDSFKSAKWDEITEGRGFSPSDAPALALLCQWYAVVERCMSDLDFGDGLPQVAYSNDMGDVKAMPQLSTMKQASAEIRALNKQLGINDEHKGAEHAGKPTITVLQNLSAARAQRRAGAAG